MRRWFSLLLLATACLVHASDSAAQAASGVMHRVFPSVADHFRFKEVGPFGNAADGLSYFVEAEHGVVTVSAESPVDMCRGAYDYLRKTVGANASWSGVSLGRYDGRLPDFNRGGGSPFFYRLQDNVCTFGYTTAFYDWKHWERYLDIMALHGINMEFSPIGGEAIWQRVWKRFGITQAQLDNFFTGPAFLPWHRMGNVNKHDGPLPESYLQKSVALEHKILKRMRELDMQPVAPAFAGFVPPGFAEKYLQETVIQVGSWAGFEGPYRTWILHPLSKMYSQIGSAFVHEWTKEFGPVRYYLADSFNELQVPVPQEREKRLAQLAAFGKAVFNGINSDDPPSEATWVMQGWLFANDPKFWDKDSVAALLSEVPDKQMLILDLYAEAHPIWKEQDAFYGKPWLLSTITTWGGNNQAYGNFELYSNLIPATLNAHQTKGKLKGYGLSFEGSESNEAQYELLCDLPWASNVIDVPNLLDDIFTDVPSFLRNTVVHGRYGGNSATAIKAWEDFANSIYHMPPGMHPNHLLQLRPFLVGANQKERVNDSETFKHGVEELVAARNELGSNQLYRNDVVQLTAQWELVEADRFLKDAVLAADEGQTEQSKQSEEQFARLALEADKLLASHPLDRLQRWVDLARAWGDTAAEKDYYEEDAKRQVTTWGGPDLSEYAAKMWSGLISGYYVPRWRTWLDAKRQGKTWDPRPWEEHWIMTPGDYRIRPFADPINEAARIVVGLRQLPPTKLATELAGTKIGGWKSAEFNETFREGTWDIPSSLVGAGVLKVRFQYTGGACRLDIDGAELLRDGEVVSSDEHTGQTGDFDRDNAFNLPVKGFEPGHKWQVRAKVRTDGGDDSNGEITVALVRRR